jgi:hypothetical protein
MMRIRLPMWLKDSPARKSVVEIVKSPIHLNDICNILLKQFVQLETSHAVVRLCFLPGHKYTSFQPLSFHSLTSYWAGRSGSLNSSAQSDFTEENIPASRKYWTFYYLNCLCIPSALFPSSLRPTRPARTSTSTRTPLETVPVVCS